MFSSAIKNGSFSGKYGSFYSKPKHKYRKQPNILVIKNENGRQGFNFYRGSLGNVVKEIKKLSLKEAAQINNFPRIKALTVITPFFKKGITELLMNAFLFNLSLVIVHYHGCL